MQNTFTTALHLDFFCNIQKAGFIQYFPLAMSKAVCLFLREKISIGFADNMFTLDPHKLFTGTIKQHKTQIRCLFHVNHRGNVFNDRCKALFFAPAVLLLASDIE